MRGGQPIFCRSFHPPTYILVIRRSIQHFHSTYPTHLGDQVRRGMIPRRNQKAAWRRTSYSNGTATLSSTRGASTITHVFLQQQSLQALSMASLCLSLLFSMAPGGGAHALSSSPVPTRRPRSFQDFQFAPNGVCLNPHCFVEFLPTSASTRDGDAATTTASTVSGQRRNFFTMRNVPGDGDCMFLAVALAAATSMGLGGNDTLLRAISKETRAIVAQVLESPPGTYLYIGPGNVVEASRLLQSAAQREPSIGTAEEYLRALRKEGRMGGLYGGGPELAVLANVLRRPISVYEVDVNRLRDDVGGDTMGKDITSVELCSTKGDVDGSLMELNNEDDQLGNDEEGSSTLSLCFPIVCKGSFGDGIFEDPCRTSIPNSAVLASSAGISPGAYSWRLHILILDVSAGEKHACVLLPHKDECPRPPPDYTSPNRN
jgi:hypothetical protein